MKLSPLSQIRRRPAFTLIELLVVMAIIALLAGLVVGGAYIGIYKARVARTQAELASLASAISSYQAKRGYYPPDNTNNVATNQLFYELTGTILTNAGSFYSRNTRETLVANSDILGLFGSGGFVNSSADPAEVDNFFPAMKTAQWASFPVPGKPNSTFTLMSCDVPGPTDVNSSTGRKVNLWRYISSDPPHNHTTYDLWIDIVIRGKTNRISNWSPTPEVL